MYADCLAWMGWDQAAVDRSIFAKYTRGQVTNYTAVDQNSIMIYPIPATWTTNGFTAPLNTTLSTTDLDAIARWYPEPASPANATGLLRTGDDCDEIDFHAEYGVVPTDVVEFLLRPQGITWWKAIEVLVGAGYRMFQMQDGRSAGGQISVQDLDTSRPIRFWKAKVLGVHTRLGFTWDVLQALPGGSRLTLTWRRDAC